MQCRRKAILREGVPSREREWDLEPLGLLTKRRLAVQAGRCTENNPALTPVPRSLELGQVGTELVAVKNVKKTFMGAKCRDSKVSCRAMGGLRRDGGASRWWWGRLI